MPEIKNGLLIDGKVTQKIISNIERPGLDFKKIKAIIIHQTDSYNASGTMNWWKASPYGAHFLIDRKENDKFRETEEFPQGSGKGRYTDKIVSYDGIDGKIYQTAHLDKRCNHAGKLRDKKYPDNYNSIGVEFVGKYNWINYLYPQPTVGQIQSGAWLVKTLLQLIATIPSMEAVYAHGVIAFKTPDKSEGGSTLEKISEELKPKDIKVESSCTEIQRLLFPQLCNPSSIFSPSAKP